MLKLKGLMGCMSSKTTVAPIDTAPKRPKKNTNNNKREQKKSSKRPNSTITKPMDEESASLNNQRGAKLEQVSPELDMKNVSNIAKTKKAEASNQNQNDIIKPHSSLSGSNLRSQKISFSSSDDNDEDIIIYENNSKNNNKTMTSKQAKTHGVSAKRERESSLVENNQQLINEEIDNDLGESASLLDEFVVGTDSNELAIVGRQQGNTSIQNINSNTKDLSLDVELNSELLQQYMIVEHEISRLEQRESLRLYHEKIEQLENIEQELDMINAEMEGARTIDEQQASDTLTTGKEQEPAGDNVDEMQANKLVSENITSRRNILLRRRETLKKEVEVVIAECDTLQNYYKLRDTILDKLYDGEAGNGLENHLEQQLNWLLEQKHYVDQVFYAWKRAETLTSQSCEQFATALDQLKQLPKVTDSQMRRNLAKSIKELLQKSRRDMEHAQHYNPNVDPPFFTDNETLRFDKIIATLDSVNIDTNSSGGENDGGSNSDENETVGRLNQSDYSQLLSITQFAYKRSMSIRLWLEQILQTTIARDSFELAEEYKWIAIQLRKERINLVKLALQDSSSAAMVQAIKEKLVRQPQSQTLQSLLTKNNKLQSTQRLLALTSSSYTPATTTIDDEQKPLQLNTQSTTTGALSAASQDLKSTKTRPSSTDAPSDQVLGSHSNNGPSNSESSSNNKKPVDSGLGESENDIEEEIYKLLEMSRPRLEEARRLQLQMLNSSGNKAGVDDDEMRNRIQRRVEGFSNISASGASSSPATALGQIQQATSATVVSSSGKQEQERRQDMAAKLATSDHQNRQAVMWQNPAISAKLKVELDEDARKSLQKQVGQVHAKHQTRVEKLRGTNRAKAASIINDKLQKNRQQSPGHIEL